MDRIRALTKADDTYDNLLNSYTHKDGLKAIALYVLSMLICTAQGFLYLSDVSIEVLDFSQYGTSILNILGCLLLVWVSKNAIQSIGLTTKKLVHSLLDGSHP